MDEFNATLVAAARDAADSIASVERQSFDNTLAAYLAAGPSFLALVDAGASQQTVADLALTSQRKVSQAIMLHKRQAASKRDFAAELKAYKGGGGTSLKGFIAALSGDDDAADDSPSKKVSARDRARQDFKRLHKAMDKRQLKAYIAELEALLAAE